MRLRHKKWAQPELDTCSFFVQHPDAFRGSWGSAFERSAPLELELGCGMGDFLADLSAIHPETNFLGVDLKSDVLGVAKRRLEAQYDGSAPRNVLLTAFDINRADLYFSQEDCFQQIYINFCNPWPKACHHKRRLTHPRQLTVYRKILSDNGFIFFRTDDHELFEDSLCYFDESGFSVCAVDTYRESDSDIKTHPFHLPGTRYEKTFLTQGFPIYWLLAKKKPAK